jgi:hypothetical protein
VPLDRLPRRTAALKEIMLRRPWRGTGIALRIHDELLAHRSEKQVSLLVNPQAGDSKVRALHQSSDSGAHDGAGPRLEVPPRLQRVLRQRVLRQCVMRQWAV